MKETGSQSRRTSTHQATKMVPVPTAVSYTHDGSGGASATSSSKPKKKAVIVGLGMVGIAFVEKLLQYDLDGGRDEWEVTV